MFNYRHLALLALALILAGCAGTPPERQPPKPAAEMYKTAEQRIANGDWKNAVLALQSLEATYPFGDYATQAELDLIYANYMKPDRDATVDEADRFVREHPRSPYVPYAMYMKGLANFPSELNPLWALFQVDPARRDANHVQESFQAFLDLVQKYPDSQYAPDARQRMVYLRNRLAKFEWYVASYYMRRGAWLAAVRRAEFILAHYPQTPTVPKALKIMADGYRHLGLNGYAADAERMLKENAGRYKKSS